MIKKAVKIRRPTQERGRVKFEAILDTAESFLEDRDAGDISIYDIADMLGTSPPTVYHFFPEISLVFAALAERYIAQLQELTIDIGEPADTWMQLLDDQCARVRDVFEDRKPIRKVMLGSGYSIEVRQRDLAAYPVFARRLLEHFERRFEMPPTVDIIDRLIETLAINDMMWMLDIYRTGRITQEGDECARRARTAYLKLYIPEFLPVRKT